MTGLNQGETARLESYLTALPTRSRLLVLLHYVDALSPSEIAAVLDCGEEEVLAELRAIVDESRRRLHAETAAARAASDSSAAAA